jgi:hypothetical protein
MCTGKRTPSRSHSGGHRAAQFAAWGLLRRPRRSAVTLCAHRRRLSIFRRNWVGVCPPRPDLITLPLFYSVRAATRSRKVARRRPQGLSACEDLLFIHEAATCVGLCPAIFPFCAPQSAVCRRSTGSWCSAPSPREGRVGGESEVRDEPSWRTGWVEGAISISPGLPGHLSRRRRAASGMKIEQRGYSPSPSSIWGRRGRARCADPPLQGF